jgi:hypothetical protein
MSSRELDHAKAERQLLRSELAKLASRREKLSEASVALAAAERARDAFEASESDAVSKWASAGCAGSRPIPDTERHVELTRAVTAARRAVESAAPAIGVIDAARSDLRDRLDDNRLDIEGAAAGKVASNFDELGTRAKKLREELAEIEKTLVAGFAVFSGMADRHYSSFGKRNVHFDVPVAAAVKALPALEPGQSQPLSDREEIAKCRAAFEALQS